LKSRCHHRFPLAILALSTAAFAGCGGDEVPPIKTPRAVVTLTAGAFNVRVDPDAGDLALHKGVDVDTAGTRMIKVGAGDACRGDRAPSSAG
jgi:hypothetical protein